MANNATAPTGKLKGYGVVRDAEGKPVFDDITRQIPQGIYEILTRDDLIHIIEELQNDARSL